MKVKSLVCVVLLQNMFFMPLGYSQEQKAEKLYIVSPGICGDEMNVFSAASFPKDGGSHVIARVTTGSSGAILEVSNDRKWYRIRLEDGKDGWITEACSGSKLQIGGEDPRIFFSLTTQSGRKEVGFLKSIRLGGGTLWQDFSIVNRANNLEFRDKQLGRIKLRYMDIKSIDITKGVTAIYTVDGSKYIVSGILGLEKESKKISGDMFEKEHVIDLETSLWLVGKRIQLRLSDQKNAKLVRLDSER